VHRVAVIGANGQVGAELCLHLSKVAGIDLVPICRNRTGSAFLRYSGISCRHGRVGHPSEAAPLIGDCDAIVNCALGTGTPSEIRSFDRALIHNLFACSPPGATIIHLSTLMVHGDPRPGPRLRLRNPYARAKLAAEKRVRIESSRGGRPGYTLRLGHVCGPLQNITEKIRKEVASGEVALPEADTASNTVYTVTIVDAIASILAGNERPGTYDLTNQPQWTWRQVYEFESQRAGLPFRARTVPVPRPIALHRRLLGWTRGKLRCLAGTELVRQTLEKCLALCSKAMNDRAQALWYTLRARAEINLLAADPPLAPELSWLPLNRSSLTSLRPTQELLSNNVIENPLSGARLRWAKDLAYDTLPPAGIVEETG
jgi:nucleoside-diphosphate-sugar epimerase